MRAAARHQRWGLLVLEGVSNIVAGIVVFLWPALSVIVLALVLGAWAIVTGLLAVAAAFHLHQDHGRSWMVVGGLVSVAWGLLLFFAPIAGVLALTLWFGAYSLAFGCMVLILAFRLRQRHGGGRSPRQGAAAG